MGARADLDRALDVLLRFGAAMLQAGDTAFRVRDAMRKLAAGLDVGGASIERLDVQLWTGGLTVTARAGGEIVTLAREIGPPGEITRKIQEVYQAAVHGQVEQYKDWLEYVR